MQIINPIISILYVSLPHLLYNGCFPLIGSQSEKEMYTVAYVAGSSGVAPLALIG